MNKQKIVQMNKNSSNENKNSSNGHKNSLNGQKKQFKFGHKNSSNGQKIVQMDIKIVRNELNLT